MLISILFYPSIIYAQTPKLVLDNALEPAACLDYQNNVICCGIFWTTDFPLIAQKVNPQGHLLWPNNTFGVRLSFAQKAGDQTTHPFILPKPDGGAFFAYEYLEFLEFTEYGTDIYFVHPVLQSVSPEGVVLWGNDGINLTNMNVRWFGGADVLELRYDNKGNVMVFWQWFDADTIGGGPNIESIYLQKVDPITGELLLDSTGIKLLDEQASKILFSKCGNSYLLHRPWVTCLNISGEIIWQLELLAGLPEPYPRYTAATNDDGDIFILYEGNDRIHCRIFTANGEPILQDTVIISGDLDLFFNTPVANWNNDKWIFSLDKHIYCIDKGGINLWGNEGVIIPDSNFSKVKDISQIDKENLMLIYSGTRYNPFDPISLKAQKINLKGEIIWKNNGILVMENIGTVAHLLPDSEGGAFIVVDALYVYEPEFRSRGTYVEKVDKDGNLGFVTSVQDKHSNSIPIDFNLAYNYPNPFTDKTTISFKSNLNDDHIIIIYNLLGKEVKRFQLKNNLFNLVQIKWDGKDQNGFEVAHGVYFYRIGSKDKWLAGGKITYLKSF